VLIKLLLYLIQQIRVLGQGKRKKNEPVRC